MLGEAALDQIEHDRDRHRGAWRSTQQGSQGTISGRHQLGTELQDTAGLGVLLDDLHALAGCFQAPVFGPGFRVKLAQGFQALFLGLHNLADQILGQVEVVPCHGQHRQDVARANRQRQVEERTVLEELGGEAGIRPEQQGLLAFHYAGVEVRHGHRRCADIGLAVDLGLVLTDHVRVVAAQPLTADREAAEALAFRNAGHLQQRQGRAAGAEEDKARGDLAGLATEHVLDADTPAGVATFQTHHTLVVLNVGVILLGQEAQQLVGQGAEVDVTAADGTGRRDALISLTAGHHQRHPVGQGGLVFGVLHAGEAVMLAQLGKTGLQKADVFLATHKAQVRHGIDEALRGTEGAFFDQVGPELLGHLEHGIDADGLLDINRAIGGLRGVVQLTQPGMAGACVVPGVGTFDSTCIHQLNDFQLNRRIQLFEQHGERCAHDAGPNQHHIHCFVFVSRHYRISTIKICSTQLLSLGLMSKHQLLITVRQMALEPGRGNFQITNGSLYAP